jgi:BON domain-containing protein
MARFLMLQTTEVRQYADKPASFVGALWSESTTAQPVQWNAICGFVLAKDDAMGTSLLWQTDTQLHDSVQRQLEWDPEIDATGIAVIASEGVVTLTGFVHTYAAKLAAERSVKRVRGVRGVANDLQVALRGERSDLDSEINPPS